MSVLQYKKTIFTLILATFSINCLGESVAKEKPTPAATSQGNLLNLYHNLAMTVITQAYWSICHQLAQIASVDLGLEATVFIASGVTPGPVRRILLALSSVIIASKITYLFFQQEKNYQEVLTELATVQEQNKHLEKQVSGFEKTTAQNFASVKAQQKELDTNQKNLLNVSKENHEENQKKFSEITGNQDKLESHYEKLFTLATDNTETLKELKQQNSDFYDKVESISKEHKNKIEGLTTTVENSQSKITTILQLVTALSAEK